LDNHSKVIGQKEYVFQVIKPNICNILLLKNT